MIPFSMLKRRTQFPVKRPVLGSLELEDESCITQLYCSKSPDFQDRSCSHKKPEKDFYSHPNLKQLFGAK